MAHSRRCVRLTVGTETVTLASRRSITRIGLSYIDFLCSTFRFRDNGHEILKPMRVMQAYREVLQPCWNTEVQIKIPVSDEFPYRQTQDHKMAVLWVCFHSKFSRILRLRIVWNWTVINYRVFSLVISFITVYSFSGRLSFAYVSLHEVQRYIRNVELQRYIVYKTMF
jgi:hypothetical protein